jgi:hypothetical protein
MLKWKKGRELQKQTIMLLTPKGFLMVGGVVLILVGLLGFWGVIGPTPEESLFGSYWWFDNGENWSHLLLGVAGLLASFTLGMNSQRGLVMLLGWVGILVGLYSLLYSEYFLGSYLQNPTDTLLHLVVGAWALLASRKKMMGGMMQ